MSIIRKSAESEALPATDTTIYTCPSGADYAKIEQGVCNNSNASSTTMVVNIVQSGGSVATTNQYISTTTVLSKKSNSLLEITDLTLEPGDFISAIAGDASRLNFKVSIKEIYS